MTEPKARPATVSLGAYNLLVDCYMMPNGEFRVSITGVSVVLGYKKDWLSTLSSHNLPKLKALQNGGFRYTP